MRFVVTFPVGGAMRDCFTYVDAETEYEARLLLMDTYGRSGWAGIYQEREVGRVALQYGSKLVPFGPVSGWES